MVKVLRPFHDGPSGRFVRPGDEVDPTPGRHDELAANGLVSPREPVAETVTAPQSGLPDAPAAKSVTVAAPPPALAKRGPGRPPKGR